MLRAKHNVTLSWVPGHVGVLGNEKADRLAEEAVRRNSDDTIDIVQDPDSFYDKPAEELLDEITLRELQAANDDDDEVCQDDDNEWTRSGRARGLPSSENDSEASAEVDAPEPTDDDFCDKEATKHPRFRKSKKRKRNNKPRTTTLCSDSDRR